MLVLEMDCPNGAPALTSPSMCGQGAGECPPDYVCVPEGRICCRQRTCPGGSTALTQPPSCTPDDFEACPTGFYCSNGACCPQAPIAAKVSLFWV